MYFTCSPFGLKIISSESSAALQTRRRIVVLPALARPITRIRNRVNFARIFSIWSAVNWGLDEVDIAKDALVDVNSERFQAS